MGPNALILPFSTARYALLMEFHADMLCPLSGALESILHKHSCSMFVMSRESIF